MFDNSQDAFISLRSIAAEHTNKIIAWVGAGLSAPSGLPLWTELKSRLCEALVRKAATLDEDGAREINGLVESARSAPTPWTAFEIIRKSIGTPSYQALVRESLTVRDNAAVPELYKKLWKLRPGGILNLNIDRLATRSFNLVHPGGNVTEFNGIESQNFAYILQSPNPFIANLHGILEDSASWVFTNSELKRLSDNLGYQSFVDACLLTRVVIFVGMSVDDVAVGSHLQRLCERGIQPRNHYWFTDRRDIATDRFAESIGIRVIRYNSKQGEHVELSEAIDQLLQYVPVETLAPPVTPTIERGPAGALPSPTEMIRLNAEDIRHLLNIRAYDILESGPPDTIEKRYREFYEAYDAAIFRAWYIGERPPDDSVLGYKIKQRVARGSFGQVYRAESPNGAEVAVKVLHEDIRKDPRMMQGFRRGVRSMQILSDRLIRGMVPYQATFEIPACVVMDYVEGANLKEAVESHGLESWEDKIRASLDLASIIRSAHVLPERVLHRDIRPSNIMLRGFYAEPEHWELVVLDFDLSWHRDAMGLTVVNDASPSGFVAPEQASTSGRDLTRNALVDSYGLGMTLFYLASRIEPKFAQHKHSDWRDTLTEHVSKRPCATWKSLPRRFARLIEWCTKDKQEDRLDMTEIVGELTRLKSAIRSGGSVESAELVAEEIAARSLMFNHYKWARNLFQATYPLATGVQIQIRGDEASRSVRCEVVWMDKGNHEYKSVSKYVRPRCEKVAATLRQSGWTSKVLEAKTSNCLIEGVVSVSDAVHRLSALGSCLESVSKDMSLD